MSEEKDLGQIEVSSPGSDEGFGGLEDFVELDDLQNLEGLADLSGLGDISDLGDLSDLSSLPGVSAESGSLDDLDTELDIPLPVMEETKDNGQEGETAEITGVTDLSGSAVEETNETGGTDETITLPEEIVTTDEEETIALMPEEAKIQEEPDNETEEPDGLSLEMADNDNIEESTEDGYVPEEAAETYEETAMDTGGADEINEADEIDEDGILTDSISLDPDAPGVMEEDMPGEEVSIKEEDLTGVQGPEEPLLKEEPGSEEDPGIMPEDILDSLGIDNITEEETQKDSIGIEKPIGIEEPEDSNDGLDGILDSLGIPEAVPGMEEEIPEETGSEEQEEAEREKKPGFFKRVFGNVVTDEIAEAERKAKEEEEEQAALKAEEEAKAKEEKEAKKAAAAEAKEAKKAAKAAKKAEKAEAKAAKKAEKAAKKEAEKEAEEPEVVGKLNKAGVIIVTAGAAILLAGVITGTNIFGYNYSKSEAERYFTLQRYSDAYNEARGTNLKDKEPELYDKIITVMKVQQSIDTYSSYAVMKYYPDALNALLRGLQKYDENIDMAMDLEIESDMKVCKNKILSILKDEFGLSEKKAYDILNLDDTAYTKRVVGIAKKKI